MNILGISAYYHDAAAALVCDGDIVAAAQEERFSRRKHDSNLPVNAMRYCLAEGGVGPDGIDVIAFYDKPITKFERILQTYFSVAPKGLRSFVMAMPIWMKEKLWIPYQIETAITEMGFKMPKDLLFTEHHESHAASAFFPSPFKSAAILTLDGVGEWATSTLGRGEGNRIEISRQIRFPHSLGLLYSAFTYFTGFRVNSGEYKLMGLAPYGEPCYADLIKDNLIDLKDDGSFRLNLEYFGYLDGLTMTNDKFASLFGGPARKAETEISKREMDIARSIQVVTEEVVMKMACEARKQTGESKLCLAGGVALNCVSNGKVLRNGPFDEVWIQPAAGDAGGALGAALFTWHSIQGQPRNANDSTDSMRGSYLGPGFHNDEIESFLESRKYPFRKLSDDEKGATIARLLDEQNVVGVCQGRMEFGPRALGNRSILGDPRSEKMQSILNLKIKHRESFRPFAPSCLVEKASDYFELDSPSPYMLLTAQVREERCKDESVSEDISMRERVNMVRSDLPAITHVDFSARIQTVDRETNPEYYDIISEFEKISGYGVVINTSFNVRGEPIVCNPGDAYACFMRTDMDCLLLGSFLLKKEDQPEWHEKVEWEQSLILD